MRADENKLDDAERGCPNRKLFSFNVIRLRYFLKLGFIFRDGHGFDIFIRLLYKSCFAVD